MQVIVNVGVSKSFFLFEQSLEKLLQGPITRLRSVTPRAFPRARGSGSLRASSPGALAAEREKEEELAPESLEFEFHLPGALTCEQALRALWRGGKKKESLQPPLWNLNICFFDAKC